MFELDTSAPNLMPGRYRQVTTAKVDDLDPEHLRAHFAGREAYRRTRFVIAVKGDRQALVELARSGDDALFSDAVDARVVAGPDDCVRVTDPSLDCGIASHMAQAAERHPDARCVIVEGQYEHISFLLNPDPVVLEVLDIVPPTDSKLVDQVKRVIDYAEDLPPIMIRPRLIDSRDLLAAEQPDRQQVLVPCRGGGVDVDGVEVSFLDERPADQPWALLGCQRSQQIHRWFYDRPADPQVDFCPRRFLDDATVTPRLTRCCLREQGVERDGDTVLVPWGASLTEVRDGLDLILSTRDVAWTRL